MPRLPIRLDRAMVIALVFVGGCSRKAPAPASIISDEPKVRIEKPQRRDLVLTVGQPSFIDSYEQTAIYAKLAGYVERWNVDIGDRVKKGQLLATLFIPELDQEHKLKQAQVKVNGSLVEQALKLVKVAEGNLKASKAQVAEAKANVGKYRALVKRWESEVRRQITLVADRVIDQQILDESQRQLEASIASEKAALASVLTAEANDLARQADLDKARVDVDVAKARVEVANADEKRLAALYGYTRLTSPFDGIVVLRNANTGDFVLPAMGDPSASPRSADQSATKGTPIYVVARTDVVRVYVDVPEGEANFIVSATDRESGDKRPVTKATVRVPSLGDQEMPAEVTRSSWALNVKSRTLRAEIDLKNPQARLLPGMYAYGRITIDRKNVRVVPRSTVVEIGNESFCFLLQNGKAVRTQVQARSKDTSWVEVTGIKEGNDWKELTGNEELISGDLTELEDGATVRVER